MYNCSIPAFPIPMKLLPMRLLPVCVLSLLSVALLLTARDPSSKVYICRSGTSYAYHNRLCQGLRRCTHKIDTVTIEKAVQTGHRKACGYCYR
ncbi:hypothetical protein LX66_2147 [Chitinophaga japonensis]|uniref:Uncharacterized protein n=1 Tax=Chitinophaga japonensis TaxID=104662 RepID=A0A562T3Y0_CHIJA|nr:hypothetical protein LX66_2147 [Chitinophaga japonensis]